MLDLPKSTFFGRIIAKEKIYEHSSANKKLVELFVNQIERIRWLNKISAETVNIERGKQVDEIEVLEIALKVPTLDNRVLSTIRKAIPHRIVFSLVYGGVVNYSLHYDDETVFSTTIPPKFIGNNLDSVWENLIVQISGITVAEGRTLDEQVAVNIENDKLARKIEKLERQAMREQQPRRKWELAEEVRKMKIELEGIQ